MEDKNLKIVLTNTGEFKNIEKATPKEISLYLTDIAYKRKRLEQLEKSIKKYVQDNRDLKPDELGNIMFGNHKIIQTGRMLFNKKKFDKEATEKEKKALEYAEKIKDRYLLRTIFYRWK